jgi:PAS domain S-box-containing protein
MEKHSEETPDWEAQRNRIIGLGETSIRKSYYPELQQRIQELEKKNRELQNAYEAQTAVDEELRQQYEEIGKKEQALRESEEFLTGIIENIPIMLFVKDATDLRFVRFNKAGEELLGYSRDEMIGKNDHDLFPKEQADFFTEKDRQVIEGKTPMDIPEEMIRTRTHGERILHTRKIPIISSNGEPRFLLGISEDITDWKHQEHSLKTQLNLGIALQNSQGLDETLGICLSAAIEISKMDAGGIYLIDTTSGSLDLAVSRNLGEEFLTLISHYPADSDNAKIVMNGKAVYDQYRKTGVIHSPVLEQEGLMAIAIIPITFCGRVIACMNVASHTLDEISLSSRIGLETISTQIGAAIEQKMAEVALRESEEDVRTMIEQSPLSIQVMSPDGRTQRVNRAFEELWGISLENLKDYNILTDEQLTRLGIMSYITRGFAGESGLIPSVQYNTRESIGAGEKKWVLGHIYPVRNAAGTIRNVVVMHEDITTRRLAEEALRSSEERYRSLVNITDTGYLVLDNRGLVIDANEVYLRLTGRSTIADLIGHPVTEWTAPYDLERNAREVEQCVKTGHVRGLEIDYVKPDGTIQPVEINATVFPTGSGDVILTLSRDISDRKRTRVALQQARNKLTLLNAVTFQDIQTAAFSLSAYQELVKTVLTDAKAKSYLEKQELFLKKMVDTLDFAKNYQEMGMHPPRWQNVHQVFLYAISHLDFLHMKQHLQLDDLEIFADPLFEKALFNIMENVLSHGVSATEVTLRFEEKPDHLTLIIEDNGVGIPMEEKNMIFDRGYGKGSGLGLFLVREVLSITGITIRETGIHGQRTRFDISVPKGAYRYAG